jgi:preprotein translocase subunit SecB
MSDDTSPIPSERFTPEPGAAPQQRPPLVINGQYVKDLSFEAPNTPQVFTALQGEQPQIQVDIDVQAGNASGDLFEVILKVRAEARVKDQLVYLLELQYAGIFTLNVPAEHLGQVLLIECPMILFPFLRRIVADATGDGGFAPLMLSPIDFAQLYQQRVQQAQAQARAQQNA